MYRGLKKNEELSKLPVDEKEYWRIGDRLVVFKSQEYICNCFPNREKPLAYDDSVYDFGSMYRKSIGSYGTYNWFRNTLKDFSAKVRSVNMCVDPFAYLVEFSDWEGVIGSMCCSILGKEFRIFEDAFGKYALEFYGVEDAILLKSMYIKFRDAFTFGTEGGAVVFC